MQLYSLNQLPLYVEDFYFRSLNDLSCKDAIVICNPNDAVVLSPVVLRSQKSLSDHIEFIQTNDVKKAIVIAETIGFLKQCPNLEYLWILPAISAKEFDYSPLYDLPNLKWLQCESSYGIHDEFVATIDYSRLTSLKRLLVSGKKGHINVESAQTITSLLCDFGYPNAESLANYIPSEMLINLSLNQSSIATLAGIEVALKLKRVRLSYNRRLEDISALRYLRNSLACLEIDACGKIKDFSVLQELTELEFLTLKGSNSISSISFIKNMPNLKYLHLTMNVEDGDLTLCENIQYVRIKNRKHYSHKDANFSKHYINIEEEHPFGIG